MKGLIVKDIQLLKNQKQFYLSIIAMCFIFLFVMENPSFVINYATIFVSLFTLGTISYDEFDNGLSYLFSLPISRNDYVKSKYILGISLLTIASIASMIVSYIGVSIKDMDMSLDSILAAGMTSIFISILFLAVALPTQFKFGAEKGRMALMGVLFATFGLVFLGSKIFFKSGGDIGQLIQKIEGASKLLLAGAGVACGLAMLGTSFAVSVGVMKNKEF